MKFILVFVAGAMLAGCADGRFIGPGKCMPDGSSVWYQYKNASGTYDGAKADAKYCQ